MAQEPSTYPSGVAIAQSSDHAAIAPPRVIWLYNLSSCRLDITRPRGVQATTNAEICIVHVVASSVG